MVVPSARLGGNGLRELSPVQLPYCLQVSRALYGNHKNHPDALHASGTTYMIFSIEVVLEVKS